MEQAEADDAMHREADARWSRLLDGGKSVPWDDARAYLAARASGAKPRRPVTRKLRG